MRKTEIYKFARLCTFCVIGFPLYLSAGTALAQDPSQPPGLPLLPPDNGDLVPGSSDVVMGIDGDEQYDFERDAEEQQKSIREQAFKAALDGMLPLRPEEIRALLERYDRTQESVAVPVYPDPKPETVVRTVTMDPGTKPLVVKTAFGNVTTVNFVDATGAPWPIRNITWAGDFDVMEYDTPNSDNNNSAEDNGGDSQSKAKGSNILQITPEKDFARGNISIRMLGLETPIIMVLEASRDIVHYRFDAVIPEYGPFARTPLIDNGITLAAGNGDISGILQGLVPSNAKKLNVAGVDGRTSAYKYNGHVYLRTPLNLLSPAWTSSVSAADGTKVYEISDTPVVLLSDKGSMVRAKISDREVILDE